MPHPPTPSIDVGLVARETSQDVKVKKLFLGIISDQVLRIARLRAVRELGVEKASGLGVGVPYLGVVEPEARKGPSGEFGILVPEYEREMRRLEGVYCPAMLFAGQYLSDWFFIAPSGMHDAMLAAMTVPRDTRHVLILGPRELGKTTIALAAELYDGLTLARLTQTHMSATDRLSEKKLRKIIDQLETNRALQAAFGILPGPVQRADEFTVRVGKRHPTVVSWQAVGFGASVRGERESRIVCDDIDKAEDSAYTWARNYEKLHGTVMGALRNTDDAFRGQVVVLGNYLGDKCTVEQLEEIDAKECPEHWSVHRFSAIETGATQHITGVPVGRSVWPQYLTTKQMEEKRRLMNMGEAWRFELEYMNLKVNPANRVWEREMFQEEYEELPARHRLVAVVTVDGTDTQSSAADDVCVFSMAKCTEGPEEGLYYIMDCRLGKLTPRDTANEAIRQYVGPATKTNPFCDVLYLEDRGTQGIGALQEVIQTYARTNNVAMNIQRVSPKAYRDKRARALRVVDLGRQGRLRWPKHLTPDLKKLREQLIMFTGDRKQHHMTAIDDGADAFVWALLMLREVSTASMQIEPLVLAHRPTAVGARRNVAA